MVIEERAVVGLVEDVLSLESGSREVLHTRGAFSSLDSHQPVEPVESVLPEHGAVGVDI